MEQQEQKSNFTLDGHTKQADKNSLYLVDFSRMQSVNDMVLILASMNIVFAGDHPAIEQLSPFLNLDNPLPRPTGFVRNAPVKADLNLPKLKQL